LNVPLLSVDTSNAVSEKLRRAARLVLAVPSFLGRPTTALPDTPAVIIEIDAPDEKDGVDPSGSKGRRAKKQTSGRYDPREYERARRRLDKALREHYRGLEALNNYRVRVLP
jgi:hypothetical protein